MTTLPLTPALEPAPEIPAPHLPRMLRRKRFWAFLLLIGFWFARPYYLPWTEADEASADTRATAAQGSIERELAMPCLAIFACYMLWRSQPLPRFKGHLAIAALAYCAVNAASVAWSVDPSTSARRFSVFMMDVLIVIALAKVFSLLDLAKIGFYCCGVVAVFAFFVDVFITHSFRPLDPDYRLMGVMNSNSQGQNISICIFCGLALLLYRQSSRWIVPALLFAAALLYFTRSRTASISCLIFSLFYLKRLVDAKYRRETRIMGTLLLVALIVPAMIAHGNLSSIVEDSFMMGRRDTQNTASLSNRMPLWSELSDSVAQRPWLGFGYNAFWTSNSITTLSEHQGWPVPNAHNTYLDQELSSGIAAVLLYTFIFWGGLYVAWKRYLRNPSSETLLAPVILSWLFLTGWVESVPLDPFFPTILAYVCLAKSFLPEDVASPLGDQFHAPELAHPQTR